MEENKISKIDISIYLIIIIFMCISCAFIYSAQKDLPYLDNFALKQAVWFITGIIVSSLIFLFDFEQIKKLSLYLYLFGILILLLLMISPESIAPEIKGIKAWFSVPGFGSIQPSELMKIFLILFLARIISDHNNINTTKSLRLDIWLLIKIFLITLLPLLIVVLQPDAGTGMVFVSIMLGMILISRIDWRIIVSIFGCGIALIVFLALCFLYNQEILLAFLGQYQLDRIHSWLDPFSDSLGISYQLSQSILSIASGMLYGKGFTEGIVYVPEAHSDFIFTTISEEFGFLGSSIIVTLYFALIYRIFRIAFKNKGEYEILIASGVCSMLTFHVFENIGMVIGLVPITGIPLPLFSYGGSSVLATIFALTIIINISKNTKKYMFGGGDNYNTKE
ncbi:FtsW/RodA/SpoVE family cell cycle protein [Psychrobacillus vulpis]|uniref:Rod shape-determining protein RodA n=1 Tax=Psychrobacillus vulpis TaxID=2325572 RepID=A0A544TTJ0_9BACI|nr:FtsW/RodA/SpoVE family cell cycle protein [Psychrobacillus vulpis]TQR20777.1 rod shape-determining protein RodA [Psychrobacillus vulpis]